MSFQEEIRTQTGIEDRLQRETNKMSLYKPRREAPEEANPANDTLISDFELLDCKKISFCGLKPLSLLCFVTAALAKSMGSAGGQCKESAFLCKRHRFAPWRRKWQPTPVFLPGESQGQRILAGYSPWGSQRVGHD